jgi:hypothetical protein
MNAAIISNDWETLSPPPMSNEATRLAVVEEQVKTMKENQDIIFRKLESIQRFQWMIGGGLALLEFFLKR